MRYFLIFNYISISFLTVFFVIYLFNNILEIFFKISTFTKVFIFLFMIKFFLWSYFFNFLFLRFRRFFLLNFTFFNILQSCFKCLIDFLLLYSFNYFICSSWNSCSHIINSISGSCWVHFCKFLHIIYL